MFFPWLSSSVLLLLLLLLFSSYTEIDWTRWRNWPINYGDHCGKFGISLWRYRRHFYETEERKNIEFSILHSRTTIQRFVRVSGIISVIFISRPRRLDDDILTIDHDVQLVCFCKIWRKKTQKYPRKNILDIIKKKVCKYYRFVDINESSTRKTTKFSIVVRVRFIAPCAFVLFFLTNGRSSRVLLPNTPFCVFTR